MIALIVLNIILIISLIFLLMYIFVNKKYVKGNFINGDKCDKNINYKKNKKINSDIVFEGRFVTDEEYQQMIKSRKSDISILLKEVDCEYEYLKELNK
jgi:uncharacterized membrane protein